MMDDKETAQRGQVSMLDLLNRAKNAKVRGESLNETMNLPGTDRAKFTAWVVRQKRIMFIVSDVAPEYCAFVREMNARGELIGRHYFMAMLLGYRHFVPRVVITPEKTTVRGWRSLSRQRRAEAVA